MCIYLSIECIYIYIWVPQGPPWVPEARVLEAHGSLRPMPLGPPWGPMPLGPPWGPHGAQIYDL